MKKIFLFIPAFLFMHILSAQNMVVVNNTPGITADYKSLQTAVDNVTDGTLILLQPGPTSYGDINIKKRVSIIGPGYFLNHNPDPNRQATPMESVIGNLTFDTLSTGSYVTGLSLTGSITGGNNRVNFSNTANVTVSRCLVYPGSNQWIAANYKSSNITFKQCFFKVPGGWGHGYILNTREGTGTNFINSIFQIDDPAYSFVLPSEYFSNYTATVLFQNNVIYNLSNPGYYPSACSFYNNIVFSQNSSLTTVNAVAASNNVGNMNYTAAGPNITNAVEANVLVLNSDPSIASPDARYKLKTGSVAIGYGQGGIDCGPFGGLPAARYELSGIAQFVPNIFYMNVPASSGSTGGLPVHIKVRANQ